VNYGISQISIVLKIRWLIGALTSGRREKKGKKWLKKTTEAGMSLKTQLEKMSPSSLF
jgi:hypothetical protein